MKTLEKEQETIRGQLEEFLRNNNFTLNQFSELTQINSGTLSGIINGHRPIAMQQLDRITAGMGLPEGYFYELYIDECFFQASPDWRRLGPFLKRCAGLNKLDCIEQVVRLMLDNLSYIPQLFNLAEQFFREGKREAAALLYESIAESEQKQHSERLALCQYRLFTLKLSKDQNKLLASHFEYFVDRLEEQYQLDALNELINVFASFRRWDKTAGLAEKLKIRATVHYDLNGSKKSPETKKPIIGYILYAYLILGVTHFEYGRYEDALHYVSLYTDCSWVKKPNEEEKAVIHQFQEWAEGNRYTYQLLSGKVEVLPEYLKYISTRENEVFIALCEIVIAANKFDINIDAVLEQYESFLKHQEQQCRLGKMSLHYTDDRFVGLLSGLGYYYLKKNDYDRGLSYVLDCLAYAIEIHSGQDMLKCVGLFEQYQNHANEDAKIRYKQLKRNWFYW